MSLGVVGRGGHMIGVLTWCVASLMMAGPVAANCAPDVTGHVLAPTEPPGHEQGPEPCVPPTGCFEPPVVGGTDIEVPPDWWQKEFVLWTGPVQPCIGCSPTNPLGIHPDLAIRWYDAAGELVSIHDTPGAEGGTVPVDALSAKVTYEGPSLNEDFQVYVDCPKA